MSNTTTPYNYGLSINDQYYTNNELVSYCSKKVAAKTLPKWQRDIYQFIVDFLDNRDFILQQTSGTTGKKKTLIIPK